MSKELAGAEITPAAPDAAAGPSTATTKASRRTGQGTSGGPKNRNINSNSWVGSVVVSCIVAFAAVAATYWTYSAGSNSGRSPQANAPLREAAQRLLHPAKGILAADESPATFGKRLSSSVRNNAGIRRQWRLTALTTPGLEEHISGVILHEETFQQLPDEIKAAASRGIAAGIKLDGGTVSLQPRKAGERATQGLDGLFERCRTAREAGATFAKWRAVFRVGPHLPSKATVKRNAADLATYAAEVQRCGLVPILEPELLAEGDHDLERAGAAAARVLRGVFRALRRRAEVDPGAVLLKAALVTPGNKAPHQASPEQVANATVRLLLRTVPRAVPGIVFLSGGQSEEAATANLLAIGRLVRKRIQAGKPPLPWALSFSFGRALQTTALAAWQRGNTTEAQAALVARARANALAQQGLPGADATGAPPQRRRRAGQKRIRTDQAALSGPDPNID